MADATQTGSNPYVGPRTFLLGKDELFFGREREGRELFSRVISERLVLFYSPSGAGKSSLINMRLIPMLQQEGFLVLPKAGVGGNLAPGAGPVENIYIYNLMLSLAPESGAPDRFSNLKLTEFLRNLTTQDGAAFYFEPNPSPETSAEEEAHYEEPNHVLIIDQFEEIFTNHPDRWEERSDFFGQLEAALNADHKLRVILALREEYVASLDSYAHLLSDRLRARFFMQKMERAAAIEAVRNPARNYGRPFEEGVAEQLVDRLREVQVAGEKDRMLGQFVEPAQLQIVCQRLWDRLPAETAGSITEQDLRLAGDIDSALSQFYEQAIAETIGELEGVISQTEIRDWFERALISEKQARKRVYKEETETGGLPNLAVDRLIDKFLLRPIVNPSGTWYELIHDTLIEPILSANRTWRFKQPLLQLARKWEESAKSGSKLLEGDQLEAALADKGQGLGRLVDEFLTASQAAEQQKRDERRNSQIRTLTGSLVFLAIMVIVFAWLAVTNANLNKAAQTAQAQAILNANTAQAQLATAILDRGTAEGAEQTAVMGQATATAAVAAAVLDRGTATAALATAVLDRGTATAAVATAVAAQEEIAQFSRARELAIQALGFLDSRPDLALLLSIEAVRKADIAVTRHALLSILQSRAEGSLDLADEAPIQVDHSLPGHANIVFSVAFSPDGRQLASASADDSIILWNVSNGLLVRRLEGHSADVLEVEYSPDGRYLASGSSDRTLILWDLETFETRVLEGHANFVSSVAFSPDGTLLATGSYDNSMRIWRVEDGSLLETMEMSERNIFDVDFSQDGRWFAAASGDGNTYIWEISGEGRFNLARILEGHSNASFVQSVIFSPDSRFVASSGGNEDPSIVIWDVASGEKIARLEGHTSGVFSLSFDSRGEVLASSSSDTYVILWDWNAIVSSPGTAPEGVRLKVGSDWVLSVAFSPTEQGVMATPGDFGKVLLWRQGQQDGSEARLDTILVGPDLPIAAAAFDATGSMLVASAGETGATQSWMIEDGSFSAAPALDYLKSTMSLAFHPDPAAELLAAGTTLGEITIADFVDGLTLHSEDAHRGGVAELAFHPQGSLLASRGEDGTIRLWSLSQNPLELSSKDFRGLGDSRFVTSLAFSPDGTFLAAGTLDNAVVLWRIIEESVMLDREIESSTDSITSLAFHPAGNLLAIGSADTSIVLWNLETNQITARLQAHHDEVTGLVFSPDSRVLASAARDGSLILWDVLTGDRLGEPFLLPAAGAVSLAFSPDGIWIAAASDGGGLMVWDVSLESWTRLACELAGTNLKLDEWLQFIPGAPYRATCSQYPIESPAPTPTQTPTP